MLRELDDEPLPVLVKADFKFGLIIGGSDESDKVQPLRAIKKDWAQSVMSATSQWES